MFDGNYRSRRRQVNLSGGRRRKEPKSRTTILEESRRLREQRALTERQNAASLAIESVVRSHCVRKALILQLDESISDKTLSTADLTRFLNLRLRYRITEDRLRSAIVDYALRVNRPTRVTAHRILQGTFRLLQGSKLDQTTVETILRVTLEDAVDGADAWRRLGGAEGYQALLSAVQSVPNYRALWILAQRATPPSTAGRAAWGALVLSQEQAPLAPSWSNFVDLVAVVTSHTTNSDALAGIARRLEAGRQGMVLAHALRLAPTAHHPAPLLQYLARVLQHNPDLALVASLLAANGEAFWQLSTARAGDAADDDDDDEDDTDEEEERRVHAPPSAQPQETKVRTGTRLTKQDLQTLPKIDRNYQSQVARWRDEVLARWPLSDQDQLLGLARQISRPEQWLQWGMVVLSNRSDTEEAWSTQESYINLLVTFLQTSTGFKARHSAASPLLTKLAFHQEFLEKLWRYVLVQVTNKGTSSSPVIYAAVSVFADVFTHRLIALKDDEFLSTYTTMQDEPRVILAEHVIVHLRDLLYELYWSRPVRAWDVNVPFGRPMNDEQRVEALRGRLLLTGTKLWQSLYERWCRLVRHSPFCDESTWLFPHMTALSSESTVVRPGRRGADNMDLDSDSENEAEDEPMAGVDAENEALAEAFSDARMARILTCIPQAMPFDRRVKLFSTLLSNDKAKTQDETAVMQNVMLAMMRGEESDTGRAQVEIHRKRLYEDSMNQLNQLGPKLRKRVQVTFFNEHGAQEAGIDGGGVFKEFIDDLIKDAFSAESKTANYQLFSVTPLQTLAVNPNLTQDLSLLSHYEFLGRVLGKAVYESILVEPQFCLPFLNQLLGRANSLEDLKNYDPEYYRNLIKLLRMSPAELDGLELTFEVSLGEGRASRTVELVPGGRSKPVNKQNVIQYVHLVAHKRLNVEGASQTKAFLRGFRDLIPAAWVRLFSAYELQKLISGDDSIRGIDVASLKTSMQYAGGYHPSQPVMHWFWEIIDEMTADEQRKFLKFMTSCSRQPLLGFASLEPAPCVQQIRLPDTLFSGDPMKNAPLPTSATCMNLLKLPNYPSKEVMRFKLLTAIESGAGFELS